MLAIVLIELCSSDAFPIHVKVWVTNDRSQQSAIGHTEYLSSVTLSQSLSGLLNTFQKSRKLLLV